MPQLHAGYYLEQIKQLVENQHDREKVEALFRFLAYFDLQMPKINAAKPVIGSLKSILSVASNLISRGIPTRISSELENLFTEKFADFLKDKTDNKLLINALHIIDPRFVKQENSFGFKKLWGKTTGGFEEDLLFSIVPVYLGEEFVQLFEIQRKLSTITAQNDELNLGFKNYAQDGVPQFEDYFFDLSVELPYSENKKRGLVVEIEGEAHNFTTQKRLDSIVHQAVSNSNWHESLRIDVDEFENIGELFKPAVKFFNAEYFELIRENFDSPLYKNSEGLAALELMLSPFLIARLQKIVLQLLLEGRLRLSDNQWDIAIIERDVSGSELAFSDLKIQLEQLFVLEGKNRKLPEIKLSIFHTDEFEKSKLRGKTSQNLRNFPEKKIFDLLIDISVLQRPSIKNTELKTVSKQVLLVKSAFSPQTIPNFVSSQTIDYQIDSKIKKKALRYFLNHIFRKTDFLSGQSESIINVLHHKKSASFLPAGGGKSIVYQLAALLQPQVTVILEPHLSIIESQIFSLKKHGIDLASRFSHERELISAKFEKIRKQQARFVFFTAELLKSYKIANLETYLSENKQEFAFTVVDEAQMLSEWGDTFSLYYQNLPSNIAKIFAKNSKPHMLLLASTMPLNSQFDLINGFQLSDYQIVALPFNGLNAKLELLTINSPLLDSEMGVATARNYIGGRKQVNVSFLISKAFYNKSTEREEKILVLMPEKHGLFGISDINGDGLADKIKLNYSGLKIENFDKIKNEESSNKLLNSEFDIYISGNELGIGMDISGLSKLILFNMPASIESFVRQIARIGRNRKNAVCYVLFNSQSIKIFKEEVITGEHGIEIKIAHENTTTVDKEILYRQFYKEFKGRKKENTILNELLTEIHFPTENPLEALKNKLLKEIGIYVELKIAKQDGQNVLHVSYYKHKFGIIYLNSDLQIDPQTETKDPRAELVLNFIQQEIKLQHIDNKDITIWLRSKNKRKRLPGIETRLAKMRVGESDELELLFENDADEKLMRALQKISDSFTPRKVKFLLEQHTSFFEFQQTLEDMLDRHVGTQPIKIANEIENLFYRTRNQQDTFKAVHRLLTLKIIDDFKINSTIGSLKLYFTKKSERVYVQALSDYVARYMTYNKAVSVFKELEKYEGKTTIQKSLNYLIDFVYSEIAERRYHVIDDMENLLQIQQKKGTKPEEINNYLHYYFGARYANSNAATNLLTDTENFQNTDFQIVIDYIQEVGEQRENLQLLIDSCSELLLKQPNSHILQLLKAYSMLLLAPKNSRMHNHSLDLLSKGLYKMKISEALTADTFTERTSLFLDFVYEQNSDLQEVVDDSVQIKLANKWLENFNLAFLDGYEAMCVPEM